MYICNQTGWTWKYVLWGLPWNNILWGMADAPGMESPEDAKADPSEARKRFNNHKVNKRNG